MRAFRGGWVAMPALRGEHPIPAGGLADTFAFQFCEVGGQMWWGGYDPAATKAAPRYTPMDTSTAYDYVWLQDLAVGGSALGVGAAAPLKTMVDTGTNALLLPDDVFNALAASLAANPSFSSTFGASFLGSGACLPLPSGVSRTQLDQMLPSLGLVFADANGQKWTIALPATRSYLSRQVADDGEVFCSAVVDTGAQGGLTLGNEAMHSLVVIFDRANKRLGLAPQVGCL